MKYFRIDTDKGTQATHKMPVSEITWAMFKVMRLGHPLLVTAPPWPKWWTTKIPDPTTEVVLNEYVTSQTSYVGACPPGQTIYQCNELFGCFPIGQEVPYEERFHSSLLRYTGYFLVPFTQSVNVSIDKGTAYRLLKTGSVRSFTPIDHRTALLNP